MPICGVALILRHCGVRCKPHRYMDPRLRGGMFRAPCIWAFLNDLRNWGSTDKSSADRGVEMASGRKQAIAMFPWECSSCTVLSRVPSEICAGRLCRGSGRRSPSKSEREPGTALYAETLSEHSDTPR